MVTEAQVWDALAEIPDPEIPVISLVDLGVVKDVAIDGDSVRIDFTPTFLGCPALEVMRDAMANQIRALGAEPQINVCLDDSWSTDRITPAGREKLRASGFAPPAPREATAPTLVQLQNIAALTAVRPRRGSRTSSARPPAGRCVIARPAGSRSNSSRRSSPARWTPLPAPPRQVVRHRLAHARSSS